MRGTWGTRGMRVATGLETGGKVGRAATIIVSMRFDIVTIFPGFFESVFAHGIMSRALKNGLVTVEAHDLREYAHDRHRTVDDRPFGGGEGMVLKPEPLAEALEALGVRARDQGTKGPRERESGEQGSSKSASRQVSELAGKTKAGPSTRPAGAGLAQDDSSSGGAATAAQDDNSAGRTRVILLSAQGRLFTQAVARELAGLSTPRTWTCPRGPRVERVVLVCGRYEGVDERINELYCDMELSIGDYVLSGGELAAAVVVDATMRLIPGVLGNEASGEFESFGALDGSGGDRSGDDVDGRGSAIAAWGRRVAGLSAVHEAGGVWRIARAGGADERGSCGDQALAAGAAAAQDAEEPAGAAGRRGAECGGFADDRGDSRREGAFIARELIVARVRVRAGTPARQPARTPALHSGGDSGTTFKLLK